MAKRTVMFLDPDTANSAICVATPTRVLAVGIADNRTKSMEGRHAVKHKIAEQCDVLYRLTSLALVEFPEIDLCVAEFPKDYGTDRWARPNDLIALSAVIGAFLGPAGSRGLMVFPNDYKGNLSKTNCQSRAFDHYEWEHTKGELKDGVRKFRIPESVRCLTDLPTKAMGDLADAVAGAKWAAIYGKRRVGCS